MSKQHEIAVIGGDGVGPEVVEAELAVLDATGAPFAYKHYDAGDDCLERTGQAMPEETLAGAKAAEAVIFGAVGASAAEVILRLRKELGAWANLRPSKAYAGVDCLRPETDMMIVRENSEGLYIGEEGERGPGVATATRVISDAASYRIARHAFEFARQAGYGKVTAVHKVNVLKKTDTVFLEACRRAAAEFDGVEYEEALVDSVAMRMILKPSDFQVMVTTNLFGDILSDLAAGLIGGLGMCPSANLGDGPGLFEPVHGSAPDIAGQGKANPSAAILCGAMLLRSLGYGDEADRVEAALAGCLAAGETTQDLGGSLSTMGMASAVVARMEG
ncbi:MAG: NAD-dependent isocitrate dehydrogenase [Desulfarculaceae bacterium]|nr:NAD-dependent isocitrate dehydrogenase [Desulfarculaceae bacterium]MCF8073692.1 NAD-dependent isocitrate dehydrogenase [Desulfarculaceae bacterium]MCF8101933.1 NAD-dependent isocitrate dehydrogenase [Desulfarculaceae bacterium]MCF8115903.1 NAD-dependent isocitrate dehydrogenase [Desulfarculaceae bacterium]